MSNISNIYPIWWDTSITVYNKYEDTQTDVVTWQRNVISNAFWKDTGAKLTVGDTTIDTNSIICRIRKDSRFLTKSEWMALPNDRRQDYFTLSPGDILVKGEVADIVDEYTSGSRSSDLIQKYKALDGCMEIQKASINAGIGRGSEHYYVIGE